MMRSDVKSLEYLCLAQLIQNAISTIDHFGRKLKGNQVAAEALQTCIMGFFYSTQCTKEKQFRAFCLVYYTAPCTKYQRKQNIQSPPRCDITRTYFRFHEMAVRIRIVELLRNDDLRQVHVTFLLYTAHFQIFYGLLTNRNLYLKFPSHSLYAL